MAKRDGKASEVESQEDMERKLPLNSNSDSDMDLSTILKKAQRRGRRGRRIILSDNEDGVDDQANRSTVTAPQINLNNDNENTNTTKVETENSPRSTPMTPVKKRAATEAYPSPPPTKKRIRMSLSPDGNHKLAVVDVEAKPSLMKRDNKPRPIVVSKRNDVDDVYPTHHHVRTPQDDWEEWKFDLSSPRLVRPLPLRYTRVELQNPHTGSMYDSVHVPGTPEDNIKKDLFLHPERSGIKWVGEMAEQKLAEEIRKYERVKKFWLFNHGYAYCPGWDCKHEFVAAHFAEEIQSPWVAAWMAELIGRKDVYLILDHLEWRMRKQMEEMEKQEGAGEA
ncbi:hypothetical protein VPNG_01785 [Cytospora leucostoma]|uniref:Uncharacterized protein n=1 Tax=Cytospora leucostoma TaxID=1230097 RepID=A0A423XIQ0_9PEZI|nr:hypothetical protein VPNG_01785 [Cytospora leucostoma]